MATNAEEKTGNAEQKTGNTTPKAGTPSKRGGTPKAAHRGRRKEIVGVVTSDKMEKTIAVTITRLEKHPKYKKYIRRRSRYYAHDEKREAKVGDRVLIQETRPLSKLKRWRLLKIVEKAQK